MPSTNYVIFTDSSDAFGLVHSIGTRYTYKVQNMTTVHDIARSILDWIK